MSEEKKYTSVEIDIEGLVESLAEDAWQSETGMLPETVLWVTTNGVKHVHEYWASQFSLLMQRYRELIVSHCRE